MFTLHMLAYSFNAFVASHNATCTMRVHDSKHVCKISHLNLILLACSAQKKHFVIFLCVIKLLKKIVMTENTFGTNFFSRARYTSSTGDHSCFE